MNEIHEKWMREALALAAKGAGHVSPNPLVGAVVVKNGGVVGRGWHRKAGGPHAEVFALDEAGERARGATLYCTLEPCNHTGRTPPCAQAVIAAGIDTVVLGACDPNPIASGGVDTLRAASVKVIEGVCALECFKINAAFFKSVTTGFPFIVLKWAMSLDGKIATESGDSKWITGDAGRVHAHRLRARYDAVLAGIGTVLADDPAMNVRFENVAETNTIRQPRRIVLDSRARTPLNSRLLSVQPAGDPLILTCASTDATIKQRVGALRTKGAQILEIEPDPEGRIPIEMAIRELGKLGIQSILVEGGAQVLGAFVDSHFADRAHVFIAPKIIGGAKNIGAIGGHGVSRIAECMKFKEHSLTTRTIGFDLLIEGALSDWG